MEKIVISGVCGTVGSVLLEYLVKSRKESLILGFDTNENGIFHLLSRYSQTPNVTLLLGDLADPSFLTSALDEATVVFHVAARKHVGICEASPSEAVTTNIIGLQNIISVCEEKRVQRFLFTSSDKAVNPTNVMGATKLLGERLVTNAHYRNKHKGLIFASTRFGNIMASSGSVIPIFARAAYDQKPLPVTSVDMSRFMMSIEQAVRLIFSSAYLASGGEIYITKMPCVNILTLAQAVFCCVNNLSATDLPGSSFRFLETGLRQGEKLFEELMSVNQFSRAVCDEQFLIIPPALSDSPHSTDDALRPLSVYNSSHEPPLSLADTIDLLSCVNISSFRAAHESSVWP